MKSRTFIALAAVTAIAVAAVIAVRPPLPSTVAGVGETVFPDLPNRLDSVASIVVRGPRETVTLQRGEGGWRILERGGYPASFEKVRGTVIALLELVRTEPKTARAEGYARLGLADVDDAAATGREISILDAAGKPLARILLGNTVHSVGGETSVFMRVPGEERAWLARGRVEAGTQPRDWLARRLFEIPAGTVRRLHVVRADGSTLTVVRDAAGSPTLKLEEVPKGARLKRPEALETMIGTVAAPDIDDVAPAGDLAGSPIRARIALTTFAGDSLSATLTERGGDRWLSFTAPLPEGLKARQEGERLTEWAFLLPGWKVEPLLKPIDELIETDAPR